MNEANETDDDDAAEPDEIAAAAAAAAAAGGGGGDAGGGGAPNLDAILAIPVTVQVVLGTTSMPVARLMKLGRGAIIQLDQKVGDPVSVLVNGRVVARGEVVVIDEDNSRFGVSLTEIVNSARESRVG
jgi:flagellar motor switch protein FliN/FliY